MVSISIIFAIVALGLLLNLPKGNDNQQIIGVKNGGASIDASLLTWDDLVCVTELGNIYEQENPKAPESEIEAYILGELERICYERQFNITPNSSGAWSPAFIDLYINHPIIGGKVVSSGEYAEAKTELLYNPSTTDLGAFRGGNADAFRHGYWNALMVKRIGTGGVYWAEQFATAYEQTSPNGVEKDMDFVNNEIGRGVGDYFSALSDDQLAFRVMTHVSSGLFYKLGSDSISLVITNKEYLKAEYVEKIYIYPNATISGDFDGDGRDDTAAFYDYGTWSAGVNVWLSNGHTFTNNGNWWYTPQHSFNPDKIRGRVVTGDFNGDGLCDIAAMYDYGSNSVRIFAYISSGTSFTAQSWYTNSGGFDANCVIGMSAGDFNGDGLCDVLVYYNYHTNISILRWFSTGTAFVGV